MTHNPLFYTSVTHELITRVARAYSSHISPTSTTLQKFLLSSLSGPPGHPDSTLAEPVFEGMWSWAQADQTMSELRGDLLHRELVDALDRAPDDTRFASNWRPFKHQLQAWKALSGDPRSVVVSSGTGSGKTECFLVPILDRLIREASESSAPLVGVRALFLYPLNALIASQRERLSSWLEPFRGKIRYALYNGDTPTARPSSRGPVHEVDHRQELWKSPPPVLVTNSTMLEYMLVRNDDASLLEKSQGLLEWIVLDEAHTYIGSQAAETALLLRRVMSAFGTSSERVRFIATSATIGGAADPRETLQKYLADIAGVDPSRIEVIVGERERPVLPGLPSPQQQEREMLLPALLAELDATAEERRHELCISAGPVRRVVKRLIAREATLGELAKEANNGGLAGADTWANTLALLDRVREVRDARGVALLPLRGHLFQRTIAGIWACMDEGCGELRREEGSDWQFGKIYFRRREFCECGARVYPLVLCRTCGVEYLAGEGDIGADLAPRVFDDNSFEDDDDDGEGDEDHEGPSKQVLFYRDPSNSRKAKGPKQREPKQWTVDRGRWRTGGVGERLIFHYIGSGPGEGLWCSKCGEREGTQRALFRPLHVGAPFVLGVSIPVLIEHAQPMKSPVVDHGKVGRELPAAGRRTITFTDSRQGTANFALKLRNDAERNFVRRTLWAALHRETPGDQDRQRLAAVRAEYDERVGALEREGIAEIFRDMVLDKLAELRREIARLEGPRALGWEAARRVLLADPDFAWAMDDWKELVGIEAPKTLAQFFLFREFSRRPPRSSSLESLGHVALRYPALQRIGEADVPGRIREYGVTLADWVDYLTLLLDYFVRANSAVRVTEHFGPDTDRKYPFDYYRWMGTNIRHHAIVSPEGESRRGKNPFLVSWPGGAQRSGGRLSRLARVLLAGLGEPIQDEHGQELTRELFLLAWQGLRRVGLLERVRDVVSESDHATSREANNDTLDAYVLVLDKQVELVRSEHAYLCPISRRLLPVSFRGWSPYDPANKCEGPFRLRPPQNEAEISNWLEHDPEIQMLRQRGIWTENSDRIVGNTPYYRVAEHSANIHGKDLRMREANFRQGKLNVLSCSTTMEMGVDIGGISSVAMNNAPPAPANYLQRAGRAGRRGETAALSLTLCGSIPHGEAVFRNPRWPFTTPVQMPRVLLSSERIVQRHVNAMCLRRFLLDTNRKRLSLTTGWLFEPSAEVGEIEHWRRFQAMLELAEISELDDELVRLVAGSALSGIDARGLRLLVCESLGRVESQWRREYESLRAALAEVGGEFKQGEEVSAAQLAISRQLQRMRGEYLLKELARRGFLPGHGFPTHVIPLVNTTMEDIERSRKWKDTPFVEHTRTQDSDPEYPTRELAVAIREYAPGNAVVLDGRVYESSGVTLNWKIPAGEVNDRTELQSFRYWWRCSRCEIQETSSVKIETCPNCNGPVRDTAYMQPSGFAVRLSYRAHNRLERRPFVPVIPPKISTGAAWRSLEAPGYGSMRSSSNGTIFHHSKGQSGHGYAVCLKCGFAASEQEPRRRGRAGAMPSALEGHKRLRGPRRTGETQCPGNDSVTSIKRHIAFGGQLETDVFELQLCDPELDHGLDVVLASTLAVALRRALAESVGVEDREIGWAINSCTSETGEPGASVVLFDTATGGAGFVMQAQWKLRQLLKRSREILQCSCDRACHACLLTYDTQHAIKEIDRTRALEFLSDRFMLGFTLPPELCLFGLDLGQLEHDGLGRAIERERSRGRGLELRLHLGGDPSAWEVAEWELRPLLSTWTSHMPIRLVVDPELLPSLSPAVRTSLASLLEWNPRITLYTRNHEGSQRGLLAELATRNGVIRWAAPDCESLVPRSALTESSSLLLIADFAGERLPPFEQAPVETRVIRPAAPHGFEAIEIRNQLDGPLAAFGQRFWQLVMSRASELALKRANRSPIVEITYSDRYIVSPLGARLVTDVISGFVECCSDSISRKTQIVVTCMTMTQQRRSNRHFVHTDWQYGRTRDEVLEKLLARQLVSRVDVIRVVTDERRNIAHARGFVVRFADDTQWTLRLDEGLGFMGTCDSHEFPFNRSTDEQAELLCALDLQISKRDSFASHMFIGQTIR